MSVFIVRCYGDTSYFFPLPVLPASMGFAGGAMLAVAVLGTGAGSIHAQNLAKGWRGRAGRLGYGGGSASRSASDELFS